MLAQVDRKYDEARFDDMLQALCDVAAVAVEVIMGLPGDSPENFRRNFERARRLPCALRVYHCVVLPSALMVRSPPEHALVYDPVSLKMQSCLGWPPGSIAAEARFLDREAARAWSYPPQGKWAASFLIRLPRRTFDSPDAFASRMRGTSPMRPHRRPQAEGGGGEEDPTRTLMRGLHADLSPA